MKYLLFSLLTALSTFAAPTIGTNTVALASNVSTIIPLSSGAVGDGATDDTTALVSSLASVPTGGTWDLAGKTYGISGLTISKAITIRNGTLKFLSTNTTGVVMSASDWTWDGVSIDGNSKSVGGVFVNNNSKNWKIRGSMFRNIYGDDVAGSATVYGITVRRGCQNGTIESCVFTNISHGTNGSRVSRAVYLTDFGYGGTNDAVLDISIRGCRAYDIAPGKYGDVVAINLQRSYSSRVIVSDFQAWNFGWRFGKVEASGTSWNHCFGETYSNGEGSTMAFSGISFYGGTNECFNNTFIGNLSLGIEVGNYTSGFESYACQAKNNLVIFTGTGASNGIGLDFSERCYNSGADGNIIQGGKYAGRLQGSVTNCQFGFTLASGQVTSGILVQSDGTNAPSGCDLGNLRIEAPSASYGFNIQGGTNISIGRARGTVANSLINRATTVSGDNALGLDNGLVVTSGTGSPEGVITAPVSSLYLRTDGGAGTSFYVKQSGSGTTGWVGK